MTASSIVCLTSILAIWAAIAGCSHPARPQREEAGTSPVYPPSTSPYRYRTADWPEAWSADGTRIAFRRVLPSRDGPPGIYVVDVRTRSLQYVMPASFFFPSDVDFSPDGQLLAAAAGERLMIADIRSGAVSTVVFTRSNVFEPRWSHSGQLVVYRRHFLAYGQPPDSAGIHIFDMASRTDRALRDQHGVVFSDRGLWAKSDSSILFVDFDGGRVVRLIHLHTTTSDSIVHLHDRQEFGTHQLQWLSTPIGTPTRFLVRDMPPRSRPTWKSYDLTNGQVAVHDFPTLDLPLAILSPDGLTATYSWWDPEDSVGVLFLNRVDRGPLGATQLTSCEPPATLAAKP